MNESITLDDDEFNMTGLKLPSVVRTTRLAVVEATIFKGMIGRVGAKRMAGIYEKIASWIAGQMDVPI